MKKSSLFLVVTLVAAMFAGCVVEQRPVQDDTYGYEKGTVSFALPSSGKKVTYQTRAAAVTGEEDLDNLVIYQFGATVLEKIYADGITISGAYPISITGTNNSNRVATINIGEDTGAKTFYLVANVNGAGQVQSSALSSVAPGSTMAGAFEAALVTDELTGTNAVLSLSTPLPMSNALDNASKGVVVADVLAAPGSKQVTLKRRVARFDIVNHKDYTNFTVTGIVVKKGNLSGKILDEDLASYLPAPNTGDGVTGDLTLTANGNDALVNADYVDYTDPGLGLAQGGLDKSLNPAQFYLYPTTILQAGGGTEIFVVGTYNGVEHVYPLTLTADVDIKANFVYQIEVQRTASHEFEFKFLEIADWEDYTDVTIAAGMNTAATEFSNLLSHHGGDLGTKAYDYSDKSGTDLELKIGTASTSELGASVTVESIANDGGYTAEQDIVNAAVVVNSPAPALETRALGSVYYKQVHAITLAQSPVPFKARVTVRDLKNSSLVETYTISSLGRFPGTSYKPVKVAGIYWAPLNVGATDLRSHFTSIPLNTDCVGYYYQWGRSYMRFENTINFTPQAGPVSAEDAAGIHATKFITNATSPGDWLTPSDDGLWSGANAQGPCPAGWRVPTLAEVTATFANTTQESDPNYVTNAISSAKIVYVQGDDGGFLYFPAAGYFESVNGTLAGMETGVFLHVGDNAQGHRTYRLSIAASVEISLAGKAVGRQVRCVLAGVQEEE
jgi:uncharacterized protein (TIGR02145 family)